jgi:hypothetical protein
MRGYYGDESWTESEIALNGLFFISAVIATIINVYFNIQGVFLFMTYAFTLGGAVFTLAIGHRNHKRRIRLKRNAAYSVLRILGK